MCLLENAEAQMLGSPSVSRGRCYAQLVLKQLRAIAAKIVELPGKVINRDKKREHER